MTEVTIPSLEKESIMTGVQRNIYYFLLSVGLTFTFMFGLWWFNPSHIPHNFSGYFHILDGVLFILVSYIVWYQIVNELFLWFVALVMKHPRAILPPTPGMRVAFLTAFVPHSEPYNLLESTLKAMVEADYPHDTWLLDEGDDAEAKRLCAKYGVKHYSRKGLEKYNLTTGPYLAKTKGGNYNSWYDQFGSKYDFVAQIDVDFLPTKSFLTKTLGYFHDPDVAFVGSPQVYGNTHESWIAKGAAEQAYSFYGAMQKGFFGTDMQLFIGANHIVRVAAHNDIEGYSAHIVEDHITGMKFYANKWKSVYIPEILAIGEGPASWDSYFSQQMRWSYGLFHILFTKSPFLFPKMKFIHVVNYFLLQQYYFYGLAQILGVLLLTLYFAFGIQSTAMSLLPIIVLYAPLLVWQQMIFVWLQQYNIDPYNESGLMLRAKLLNLAAWPIYFMALVGVILRKRLTYKVTPKGREQRADVSVSLFLPHFILGTITAMDIIVGILNHNQAPQLLFWAVMNTIIMYYFVTSVVVQKYYLKLNNILFSKKLRRYNLLAQ